MMSASFYSSSKVQTGDWKAWHTQGVCDLARACVQHEMPLFSCKHACVTNDYWFVNRVAVCILLQIALSFVFETSFLSVKLTLVIDLRSHTTSFICDAASVTPPMEAKLCLDSSVRPMIWLWNDAFPQDPFGDISSAGGKVASCSTSRTTPAESRLVSWFGVFCAVQEDHSI